MLSRMNAGAYYTAFIHGFHALNRRFILAVLTFHCYIIAGKLHVFPTSIPSCCNTSFYSGIYNAWSKISRTRVIINIYITGKQITMIAPYILTSFGLNPIAIKISANEEAVQLRLLIICLKKNYRGSSKSLC